MSKIHISINIDNKPAMYNWRPRVFNFMFSAVQYKRDNRPTVIGRAKIWPLFEMVLPNVSFLWYRCRSRRRRRFSAAIFLSVSLVVCADTGNAQVSYAVIGILLGCDEYHMVILVRLLATVRPVLVAFFL